MRITYPIVIALSLAFAACDGPSREVGAPCLDDFDCRDRCLEDWPGGFCTLDCRDNGDCPPDAVCIDSNGGVCMLLCDSSSECKDYLGDNDYRCNDRRDRDRDRWDVCVPD